MSATLYLGNLPDGRKWGALNGVDIDRDGVSVWMADRCGANPATPPGVSPFQWDSCAGSKLPPVLKFDASGNLLRRLLTIGKPGVAGNPPDALTEPTSIVPAPNGHLYFTSATI